MTIRILTSGNELGDYADLYWTKDTGHPIYMREFAEGVTVAEREANFHDDSDFYATYFDAETGTFKEVMFGTTRGWSYPAGAVVDATPDIMEKYHAHLEAAAAAKRKILDEHNKLYPAKGKRVRIEGLTKRSKAYHANGKTGMVIWTGEKRSKYGTWHYGLRVGVLPEGAGKGEAVFVDSDRLVVLDDAGKELGKAVSSVIRF